MVNHPARHFNGRAPCCDRVGNLVGFELFDDRRAILGRQIRVERAVVHPIEDKKARVGDRAKDRQANENQTLLLRRQKRQQTRNDLLQLAEKFFQLFRHG